jgi:hypothetical protein
MTEAPPTAAGSSPSGWRGRVAFGPPERPVAFRPGQVLVAEEPAGWSAVDGTTVQDRLRQWREGSAEHEGDGPGESLLRLYPDWSVQDTNLPGFTKLEIDNQDGLPAATDADLDNVRRQTLRLIDELKALGLRAQPNHVFFADQGGVTGNPYAGNPYAGNPYAGNPYAGNPYAGNPYAGNPYAGNPYAGNPYAGNPYAGNPYAGNPRMALGWPTELDQETGIRPSSAQPRPSDDADGPAPRVLVLDTGLPADPARLGLATQTLQGMTPAFTEPRGRSGSQITVSDLLSPAGAPYDVKDRNQDGVLDPASGHGAFIAAIIARIAPQAQITVVRVLGQLGDGDEQTVSEVLHRLAGQFDLINLSFGTYTPENAEAIADAVRTVQRGGKLAPGTTEPKPAVVVASAGNDATWTAPVPASLPDVVAVAALDWHEQGPAPFSNYGPWVSACAPGTDIQGGFWKWGDGERLWPGKASWSGTSFAAPYVVGALARTMQAIGEQDPNIAVQRLLHEPALLRIPFHGTVVRGF